MRHAWLAFLLLAGCDSGTQTTSMSMGKTAGPAAMHALDTQADQDKINFLGPTPPNVAVTDNLRTFQTTPGSMVAWQDVLSYYSSKGITARGLDVQVGEWSFKADELGADQAPAIEAMGEAIVSELRVMLEANAETQRQRDQAMLEAISRIADTVANIATDVVVPIP